MGGAWGIGRAQVSAPRVRCAIGPPPTADTTTPPPLAPTVDSTAVAYADQSALERRLRRNPLSALSRVHLLCVYNNIFCARSYQLLLLLLFFII